MEALSLTPELLLILFAVAVVAGCLDTLVGGGGLIVLPALVLAGIPPLQALGTNKMQGTMGTATASLMMLKHGKVSWSHVKPLMLVAFIGSGLGSLLVQIANTGFLRFMIPVVLVLVAGYFLLSGTLMKQLKPVHISESRYRRVVVPLIGLYDGMFGPGTGSFFSLAGVALQAQPLLQATAIAKTLNFATNFASLLVFVVAGNFIWQVGICMMAGQALGAWAGSHILFKINPLYLRALIVLICLVMLARYLLT
ncbi:MAG: TSUP family transporter [Pseudomonadota bacterium]